MEQNWGCDGGTGCPSWVWGGKEGREASSKQLCLCGWDICQKITPPQWEERLGRTVSDGQFFHSPLRCKKQATLGLALIVAGSSWRDGAWQDTTHLLSLSWHMGKWWAKIDFLFFPIGFQSWQPDCWYFHTLLMAMEILSGSFHPHLFSSQHGQSSCGLWGRKTVQDQLSADVAGKKENL